MRLRGSGFEPSTAPEPDPGLSTIAARLWASTAT